MSASSWNTTAPRNAIAAEFATAFAADFRAHGAEAIAALRQKDPGAYLRLAAAIEPAAVVEGAGPFSDLTDEEIAQYREVVAAILAADRRNAPSAD